MPRCACSCSHSGDRLRMNLERDASPHSPLRKERARPTATAAPLHSRTPFHCSRLARRHEADGHRVRAQPALEHLSYAGRGS